RAPAKGHDFGDRGGRHASSGGAAQPEPAAPGTMSKVSTRGERNNETKRAKASLRCAALQLHAASATRAVLRQRDVDPFIEARRNGAAGSSTVGATGFPGWGLGVRLQF